MKKIYAVWCLLVMLLVNYSPGEQTQSLRNSRNDSEKKPEENRVVADKTILNATMNRVPTVKGTVIYAETSKPAPGVKVCFTSQSSSLLLESVTTDSKGRFSLPAPVSRKIHGYLEVKEPGIAPVKIYLRPADVNKNYIITLRKTGIISGKVINQFDKPVKGVIVEATPCKWPKEKTMLKPEERDLQEQIKSWYEVHSETPTDESGQFVISNAAAPAIHNVMVEYIEDRHYRPADSVIATITPEETATVKLRVFEKPCLLLKVLDSKGVPVLDYILGVKSKTENTSSLRGKHVVLSSDEWERVSSFYIEDTDRVILHLVASDPSGGKVEKNNIECFVGSTNRVTLVLDDSLPIAVAGVIKNSAGVEVTDNTLSICYYKGFLQTKTDHTGNFFVKNIPAEVNSEMKLGCVYNGSYFSTNILIGKECIEWTLPKAPEKTAANKSSFDLFKSD